ncbi:exonuclease 1 [Phtheirospermum japonicum]|uniref:Exonuclease 1 n=1 Tax=Phtheirospermum japonicum TaxID=374723 RepID=A0A830BZC6_9LAMI|nr:exonuclease 1 [Phtheirospermum japonicum]
MGIQGLLPLLKSIMNPIHIKELEGCFVAVDTYSWLPQRRLFLAALISAKANPLPMNMLRHYGVKPVLVFDGGPLPMKGDQEIKRARSRNDNLSRALEHEANGNRSAAYECYQKAVDISPSVLRKENVSYVVAPYEADAQMTFLALGKRVDAVITEDSDLIAFGCPRIIYKMDKFGQGVEFKNEMLQYNKELNLVGFNQMMLLEMCILSGCDYLQSLPGMGLKKAHALIKKFKNHQNVIKHLKYSNIEVSPLYEESFRKAILTFRHQRVYDPVSEEIVHLSEPEVHSLTSIITSLTQHVAQGIARGDLDPFTKLPIQGESDATEKVINGTYQLKNFKPDGERKKLDLPAQKNLLTNYFCFASLEAKRKFRAPRITPNHPNESNGNSSLYVHEAKHSAKNDDLKFTEVQDHDLESDQETGKPASGNKNVVVRSSYFTKKPRDENGKESKTDDNELDEGTCRNEEKRVDEHANDTKWSSGSCTSDLEEEKLASNISHLGRYSDISERSMEKFVSAMSSFQYSSSGSRASGLRAPLKDIKNNICMKSSTLDVDLRKFSYVPTKPTTNPRFRKSKI